MYLIYGLLPTDCLFKASDYDNICIKAVCGSRFLTN